MGTLEFIFIYGENGTYFTLVLSKKIKIIIFLAKKKMFESLSYAQSLGYIFLKA